MGYGVDPHTTLLIVATTLPGMFLLFVIVGTWVYLHRRHRHKKYLEHRRLEDGEQAPGEYEKWLEQIAEPGASQAPSQNPSSQNIPLGRIGVRTKETRGEDLEGTGKVKNQKPGAQKSNLTAVEEREV